jgi:hypothetical protein
VQAIEAYQFLRVFAVLFGDFCEPLAFGFMPQSPRCCEETRAMNEQTPLFPQPLRLAELFSPTQDWFTKYGQASERLLQGMVNIAFEQSELGRCLMDDALTELRLFADRKRPDEIMKAELEIMRRRAEHIVSGMRKITDEIRQCCFETSELALSGLQQMQAGMGQTQLETQPVAKPALATTQAPAKTGAGSK